MSRYEIKYFIPEIENLKSIINMLLTFAICIAIKGCLLTA